MAAQGEFWRPNPNIFAWYLWWGEWSNLVSWKASALSLKIIVLCLKEKHRYCQLITRVHCESYKPSVRVTHLLLHMCLSDLLEMLEMMMCQIKGVTSAWTEDNTIRVCLHLPCFVAVKTNPSAVARCTSLLPSLNAAIWTSVCTKHLMWRTWQDAIPNSCDLITSIRSSEWSLSE